ncbi:MAG TPA: hypothetical protein VLL72_03390, partial [Kiloniellales bacterium]|nr:hypothetical protein [Kiloniellales bacterium]
HRVAVMNNGVIEQLGTPKEIYNDPRTLFVAGFIGSPPMNFIEGTVENGVFEGRGIRVEGLGRAGVPHAVLGVRAEDAQVLSDGEAGANLTAPIYSVELMGESCLVTLATEGGLLTMRADKNFTGEIDHVVGARLSPEAVFLFDKTNDARVDF